MTWQQALGNALVLLAFFIQLATIVSYLRQILDELRKKK